eukprot:9601-Heterococcus_DN1.PRE.1
MMLLLINASRRRHMKHAHQRAEQRSFCGVNLSTKQIATKHVLSRAQISFATVKQCSPCWHIAFLLHICEVRVHDFDFINVKVEIKALYFFAHSYPRCTASPPRPCCNDAACCTTNAKAVDAMAQSCCTH